MSASPIRDILRNLPRFVAIAVVLYLSLHLLLVAAFQVYGLALATDTGGEGSTDSIQIDSPYGANQVSVQGSIGQVLLRGIALPDVIIEAQLGERVLGRTALLGRDNSFNFYIQVPIGATTIELVALRLDDTIAARTQVTLIWPPTVFSGSLDLALYISESHQLWVAGQTGVCRSVALTTPGGEILDNIPQHCEENSLDDPFERLSAFDLLLDVETPPAQLQLQTEGLPTLDVQSVSLADLPLIRSTDWQLSADSSELRFQARLPVSHPYFRALAQHNVSAAQFINALFGNFGISSRSPQSYDVDASVGIESDQGVVDIRIRNSNPPQRLRLRSSTGIGSVPLMSPKDQVSVQLNGLSVGFGDQLPDELTSTQAIWRGPKDSENVGPIVEVYLPLPSTNSTVPSGSTDNLQPQTQRDFIRTLDRRLWADAPFIQASWNTLLSMLPYILLIWLLPRWKLGNTTIRRALVATAIVLALWRIMPYFFYLLHENLGAYLLDLYRHSVLVHVHVSEIGAESVFLLLVILFALLSPVYLRRAIGGASKPPDKVPEHATQRMRFRDRLRAALFMLLDLILLIPSSLLFVFGLVFVLSQLGTSGTYSFIMEQLPWWTLLAILAATTLPLVLLLLRFLAPYLHRLYRSILAFVLVGVVILIPYSQQGNELAILGGFILSAGFGWVIVEWLRKLFCRGHLPLWSVVLFAAATFLIALPIGDTVSANPRPAVFTLFDLITTIQQLSVYVLILVLALLLMNEARKNRGVALRPELVSHWWSLGCYFFAVCVVNSLATWMLLPISLIVGWLLARYWLFRPMDEVLRLGTALKDWQEKRSSTISVDSATAGTAVTTLADNVHEWIKDTLDANVARRQKNGIVKKLDERFTKAELTPAEYTEKMTSLDTYFRENLELEVVAPGIDSRQIAFATGQFPAETNARMMMQMGILLVLVPLLITFYQYLPIRETQLPYALADLFRFFVTSVANWLSYAFFFGYFYVHLRGNTGLSKGLGLFVALIIPYGLYRVLNTQSLDEMSTYFVWATQVFLFSTLLGLMGVDYRLLRQHGFGFRDLVTIHNLSALTVYASTLVLAVLPTITALLTQQLGAVLTAFVQTVLPQAPPAP